MQADYIGVDAKVGTQELVHTAHLKQWGVDGIFSNYPDRVR